jgi:aspartyl protease family protein
MMKFAVFAIMAAMASVGVAQTLAGLEKAHQSSPAQAAVAMVDAPSAPASASITKSADGHYWTQADVDGHPVTFLIDTGATAVALTPDDARRMGLDVANLDYAYKVSTANGEAPSTVRGLRRQVPRAAGMAAGTGPACGASSAARWASARQLASAG